MSAEPGAEPRAIGRPSKYDPAYCDMVIEFMGRGFSQTAFAGHINVDRDTLLEWARVHPDFSGALKVAKAKRTGYLEGGLLSADAAGPQITARIFALKNAAPDEWKDRYETENKNTHTFTGSKETLAAKLNRAFDSGTEGEAG